MYIYLVQKTIVFNHIPRTGGTTLRIILNKVYGKSAVFFINSRNIPASLSTFSGYSQVERDQYRVIAGHGALQFRPLINDSLTVSILRDPFELFRSQYYYLRRSPNSNFLREVRELASFEDYLEYALEKGQDNMMVRCLDPDNKQFMQAASPAPDMNLVGKDMLDRALSELERQELVFSLSSFDKGIYVLANLFSWSRIPLYRPLNKARYGENNKALSPEIRERLQHMLRFDIELYKMYSKKIKQYEQQQINKGMKYKAFMARQRFIRMLLK